MDSFGLYKHKLIFVSCLLIVNTRSPSITAAVAAVTYK